MATLREFFTTEAGDYIAQLTAAVVRLDTGAGDVNDLHQKSRGLRGSAQMAREERVYRAALGLEAAARSVAGGVMSWTEDVSNRVRRTLEDIDAMIKGGEADDAADSRLKRSLDRWRDLGLELPAEVLGQVTKPTQVNEASRQFAQFAAHEIAGIITEMEVALETLAREPRNRDPLKAILRRQRALLGAARLDEISVVAEALRATEDMTRVIAKLNVPVKEEWLAVFRSARDVLKSALEPLQKGEPLTVTPALSQLRTLRQELLERHGAAEPAPAAPAPAAPTPAAPTPAVATAPATPPATAPADGIVPIEQLLYSGPRALQRALELQGELERMVEGNAQAREAVDEVFDLIRLGSS